MIPDILTNPLHLSERIGDPHQNPQPRIALKDSAAGSKDSTSSKDAGAAFSTKPKTKAKPKVTVESEEKKTDGDEEDNEPGEQYVKWKQRGFIVGNFCSVVVGVMLIP